MDGPERFSETCLPCKDSFFSKLNDVGITDEDYDKAHVIWETFHCKTLQDYHDIYLKTDVLLLADCFEAFRTMSLKVYKLDPVHYYTLPSLSWDALLKMTSVKLDLISDPEIYLFLENSIRGSVSMISHRYAKANNPLVEGYDESKPNNYIIYLDANNLYGWAMQQYLPISDFRFMSDDEIRHLDIDSIADDSSTGYILEVDLKYPSKLHDLHNCFPLAPEKMKVNHEMLSPYCKNLSKGQISTEKLIPNLQDKQKYVLHYRNLKLYKRLGLEITKIHRVLSFTQKDWMRPYIETNTKLRQNSKTEFEKDLFKLLNNAVFGKSLQNCRNYMDLRLVSSPLRAKKLVAKPSFKYFHHINEDLVTIEMMKPKIVLNKPVYAGFSILDLSKVLIYEFHYDVIKHRYGDDAQLLFSDTDSLTYQIRTQDLYQDMYENKEFYDTSNYDVNSKLYSKVNAKVVGKMKDETGGRPIFEFIGLRPKMYSVLTDANTAKITAKGIKKCYAKNNMKHSTFLHTLENGTTTYAEFHAIQSKNHSLHTVQINKVALSAFDDKRYILEDGKSSLAYGHYSLL
jgi:hypothetical protein